MKRALLCGSQIEGLRGVTQDVQRMAAHLAQRGFEVQTRTGERATRAGILAGYDELIAASAPGDAAVFFYAGHGGRATLPGEHGRTWRCIAPTDLRAGTDDDWRGITGWELSIKQAQLTARTANATVILDCCHAAMMSRDAAPRHAIPRALPHPLRAGFEAHLSALRATYGADCEDVDVLGSADAARLVACDEHQTAWESPDAKGDFGGVFTRALLAVLQEVGEVAVSWAALADAVRARVLRSFAHQRPDVEGPLRRQVFSLVEADDRGIYTFLPARHRASGLRLPVGRLTGAHVGDVYGVMPVGSREYDEPRALATVELVEVAALTSRVGRLADAPALPPDAVAIALHKRAERRAVALDAPSWALASLTLSLIHISEPTRPY